MTPIDVIGVIVYWGAIVAACFGLGYMAPDVFRCLRRCWKEQT